MNEPEGEKGGLYKEAAAWTGEGNGLFQDSYAYIACHIPCDAVLCIVMLLLHVYVSRHEIDHNENCID
jgi:hypothetical protein